ncbi:ABC transporter permease subunit [Lysinibacillus parviboronicapiens]|uniref:ABC transporter permease subunit n=1 Tax=Lysinibacillus parviboronicapiens TaxID=436516 RepID=UPI0033962C78
MVLISKKTKLAVAISTGLLLMTYILSIAIDLNEKLTLLKYLTPFKYFEAKIVMNGNGLERKFIILSLSIVIIFPLITFVFYRKKDLQV